MNTNTTQIGMTSDNIINDLNNNYDESVWFMTHEVTQEEATCSCLLWKAPRLFRDTRRTYSLLECLICNACPLAESAVRRPAVWTPPLPAVPVRQNARGCPDGRWGDVTWKALDLQQGFACCYLRWALGSCYFFAISSCSYDFHYSSWSYLLRYLAQTTCLSSQDSRWLLWW